MIKFFRRIRQQLISENKFSKYLLYALGEIILVVIGILIALQINSWKSLKARQAKEITYLKGIKSNLSDDLVNIDRVIEYNKSKMQLIDSTFYTFERYNLPEDYMPHMNRYMYVLTTYDIFETNSISFDNMVAAENVDLISNDTLRAMLSQYYKKDLVSYNQESVKQRTRQFTDYVGNASFNRQSFNHLTNYDSSLRDISEITIHEDPEVYGFLFNMLMSTKTQNEFLIDSKGSIEEYMRLIDLQIED